MKKLLPLALAVTGIASAGTVLNYNTTGSTLSCNGLAGCVQTGTSQVILGGLALTYNSGSGSAIITDSLISFGSLTVTGSGTANVNGLLLTLNVNSSPPGSSGVLPNGTFSGTISTNTSAASLTFGPNNTTTGFGTLPGVVLGGAPTLTFQVYTPVLSIAPPTANGGVTAIGGAVTGPAMTPEPTTWVLMLGGLGVLWAGRHQKQQRTTNNETRL